MIKVKLLGELGKKFGRTHNLAIKSPAEAVRALCANFQDFEKFVIGSGDRGVSYRVIADRQTIGESDLHNPVGKTITIAPVVSGAGGGGGVFQTFLGVVLIAASFFVPAPFNGYLLSIGISMTIGGVIQMLSPVPKTPDYNEETTNPSYIFSGAVNTTAQGHPVPIGYGRLIVGSAVISAGIVTEEII